MSQQFKLQEVLRILSKDEANSVKRLPNEMDLPWGGSSLGLGAAVALPQAFTSFMSKTVVRMRLGAPWVWSPPEDNGTVNVSRDSSIFDRKNPEKKRMLVSLPLKVKLFGKLPDTREDAAAVISCLVTWGGQKEVERTSDAVKALVEGGLESISRAHNSELASAIRDNEAGIASDLKDWINKNGLGVEELLLEPFRVGSERIDLNGRKGGVITLNCKNEWKPRRVQYQAQLEWSDEQVHQVASYLYRGSIMDSDTASGTTMLLTDQVEPIEKWLRQLIAETLNSVEWPEAQRLIANSTELGRLITHRLGLGTGRKIASMQISESDKSADRRFGSAHRFERKYETQNKDQPIIFSHVIEYRVDDPGLLQERGIAQSKAAIEPLLEDKVKEWTKIWVTRRAYTDILKIMEDEDKGQAQIRDEIGHLVQEIFSDFGIEITNFEALTSIPGFQFKQPGGVRLDLEESIYSLSDPSGDVTLSIEAAVFADSDAGRRFEGHLFDPGEPLEEKAKKTIKSAVSRVLGQVETRQFYRSRYVYGKNIPISLDQDSNAIGQQLTVPDTTLPDLLANAVDNALVQDLGLKLKKDSLNLRISKNDRLMQRMLGITGHPISYDAKLPELVGESHAATEIHLKAEMLATDICLDDNRTFLNAFKRNNNVESHIDGIKELIAGAHDSLTLANLDPEHLLNPEQQVQICEILSRGIVERAESSHGVKLQVNSMFISVSQPNKSKYLIDTEKMLTKKMQEVKSEIIEKLGNPFEEEDDIAALRRSERVLEEELDSVNDSHRNHRKAGAGLELEQKRSGGAIEFKPLIGADASNKGQESADADESSTTEKSSDDVSPFDD